MTQDPKASPQSMRYTIDEVLSGMLASIERDTFTDDSQRLEEEFKGLAKEAPRLLPSPVKPTFPQSWKERCKPWSATDTWSTAQAATR